MAETKLDILLRQADEARKQFTAPGAGMPATPTQEGLIKGVSRAVGTPMDLLSMGAQALGISEQPTDATASVQKGMEQLMGVTIPEQQTGAEIADGYSTGDVVADFLTGAIETAPAVVASTGPAIMTPQGLAFAAGATIAGGAYNALAETPYFQENPLASYVVDGASLVFGLRSKAAKPSKDFDPNRPLTEAESGDTLLSNEGLLTRERVAEERSQFDVQTQRSQIFENTLRRDLNIVESNSTDPVESAKIIAEKVNNRVKALHRKLSSEADAIMAKMPDTFIPIQGIKETLRSPKLLGRGVLTEPSQRKAVELYAESMDGIKSVNPQTLHEEMKRVGEVAYSGKHFRDTAFYARYKDDPKFKEMIEILEQMPEQSLQTWAKTMYRGYNKGLDSVIKEGVPGSQSAKSLQDFKAVTQRNIEMMNALESSPLRQFFGKDFAQLNSQELAKAINETDPKIVRQFSATLRKTNPDAFNDLRETVFLDFLDKYKQKGTNGGFIFDWEALSDPKVLKELSTHEFLKTGADGVAFSQTLKAIAKMQKKFEPGVMGAGDISPERARQIQQGVLQTLRGKYYNAAIVTQGLATIIRGFTMSNAKTLSLFSNAELQLMTKVANGQKIGKDSAQKLADKFDRLGNVLFAIPATVTGGRMAAASGQEVGAPTELSKLDQLIKRAEQARPKTAEEIPFGA